VIGGTQFMGRETVERLIARGHEVSVLHRRDHNLQAVCRIPGSEPFEAVLDFAYDWEHGTTDAQVEAAARSYGPGLER
jgi:nucleoside-diphosphate-sugar epimerase